MISMSKHGLLGAMLIVVLISSTSVAFGAVALWRINRQGNLYMMEGNVGIGTTTPTATLEVRGDVKIDGDFVVSGAVQQHPLTEEDLVGQWSCKFYMPIYLFDQVATPERWIPDNEGIYAVLSDSTLTFRADGDGTYSFSTAAPNPFNIRDNEIRNYPYKITEGNMFIHHWDPTYPNNFQFGRYSLDRASRTQILLTRQDYNGEFQTFMSSCEKTPSV